MGAKAVRRIRAGRYANSPLVSSARMQAVVVPPDGLHAASLLGALTSE